jgi:predicted AlkP superfamily pyrophosphatase or phosphodiesterase
MNPTHSASPIPDLKSRILDFRYSIIFLLVLLPLPSCNKPAAKPAAPSSDKPRVLIVTIDGLRPDVALRADMPNLRSLMARGAFTFWARTVEYSYTLPAHVSMLTGVTPERHGITWDDDAPEKWSDKPPFPSLFDLAKARGFTTAMAMGKPKLQEIPGDGMIDWSYVPADYQNNPGVGASAASIIRLHQPQVMFVHLPDTDSAGHGSGWGSPEQLNKAHDADTALGVLIAALRDAGVLDRTNIFVTSDHGGAGFSHGPDDVRSRTIPWVFAGPGTRQNHDLTRNEELTVNIEDTFATCCWLLGIPQPPDSDGKPVMLAFPEAATPRDLRRDAGQP